VSGTIRVGPLSTFLTRSTPEPEARSRVAALCAHLEEQLGRPINWKDEGPTLLEEPWNAFELHALRSLAAHQEYPVRFLLFKQNFRLREDPRDHPGLRKIFDGSTTAFPHLMRHSDNKGMWIPVGFDHPLPANEPQWWMVGSVQGVVEELGRIAPHVAGEDARLREAFERLQRIFGAAAEAGLPVVIDGA
jgi:hypothetical protein